VQSRKGWKFLVETWGLAETAAPQANGPTEFSEMMDAMEEELKIRFTRTST
jgi:hypothetical protein